MTSFWLKNLVRGVKKELCRAQCLAALAAREKSWVTKGTSSVVLRMSGATTVIAHTKSTRQTRPMKSTTIRDKKLKLTKPTTQYRLTTIKPTIRKEVTATNSTSKMKLNHLSLTVIMTRLIVMTEDSRVNWFRTSILAHLLSKKSPIASFRTSLEQTKSPRS